MYIGIDIGGMTVKAGVVDESGKIIAKHSVTTPLDGNESFMASILEAINLAINDAKTDKSEIKSIGIGAVSGEVTINECGYLVLE